MRVIWWRNQKGSSTETRKQNSTLLDWRGQHVGGHMNFLQEPWDGGDTYGTMGPEVDYDTGLTRGQEAGCDVYVTTDQEVGHDMGRPIDQEAGRDTYMTTEWGDDRDIG